MTAAANNYCARCFEHADLIVDLPGWNEEAPIPACGVCEQPMRIYRRVLVRTHDGRQVEVKQPV